MITNKELDQLEKMDNQARNWNKKAAKRQQDEIPSSLEVYLSLLNPQSSLNPNRSGGFKFGVSKRHEGIE